MLDAVALLPMAAQQSDPLPPRCPQFQPLYEGGAYPIPGYCALSAAPGALMIPSLEEFRTLCTTPMFHHCPWCETRQAGELPGATAAARHDRWACPTLRWSRTSG